MAQIPGRIRTALVTADIQTVLGDTLSHIPHRMRSRTAMMRAAIMIGGGDMAIG